MRETEAHDPASGIRQGDIFRLEQTDSLGADMGVVINADCDLANDKVDGLISYLPLYPLDKWFVKYCVPRIVREKCTNLSKAICNSLKISPTEAEDLHRLLVRLGPEETARALADHFNCAGRPDASLFPKLTQLHHGLSPAASYGAWIEKLRILGIADKKHIAKTISSEVKNAGDSHFYISELHGHKEVGYIIRLRRIHALPSGLCYKDEASCAANSTKDQIIAIRIAKLSILMKVRLMQMFAIQYTRIGLPNDLHELQEIAVGDLAQKIAEGEA